MKERFVPYFGRLVAKIREYETPLVHLWGWPGSGKSAWVAEYLRRHRGEAVGRSWGELGDAAARRDALAEAGEARLLVVYGEWDDAALSSLASWLRPEQRLLVVGARRPVAVPLPASIVPPQDLLLTPEEVALLGRQLAGSGFTDRMAASLHQATDGWYRPLRLVFAETAGGGLADATAAALLDIPALRLFFQHEVFGVLPPEDQARLLEDPSGSGAARADHGYWIESGGEGRLPALLAAHLERERRAARTTSRRSTANAKGQPVRYVVRLLGDPEVEVEQGGVVRPVENKLRRSLQILAHLASSSSLAVGREELIEAIWSDASEETIERNFHPTLSYLRRDLEAPCEGSTPLPLLFRAGVYRLNPDLAWDIDVVRFSRLVEEGKLRHRGGQIEEAAAAYRAAWKLYRGPFLAGHYEVWVTARREVYQRLYIELLRDLGDLSLRLGRPEEAMDAYRAVLVEDPLQERIYLAVMRLYAAQGRRDLVRRMYDRLCTLLQEELGVEPLPETSTEYHRLML